MKCLAAAQRAFCADGAGAAFWRQTLGRGYPVGRAALPAMRSAGAGLGLLLAEAGAEHYVAVVRLARPHQRLHGGG